MARSASKQLPIRIFATLVVLQVAFVWACGADRNAIVAVPLSNPQLTGSTVDNAISAQIVGQERRFLRDAMLALPQSIKQGLSLKTNFYVVISEGNAETIYVNKPELRGAAG